MGSEEDMKQAIIDGEVSEFVNSIDEQLMIFWNEYIWNGTSKAPSPYHIIVYLP